MIDIIIPAYNCSKTLPKTLASIATQTQLKKCIVTIVDDCSTENLMPIIEDFRKMFGIKIQYIKLSKNCGSPGLVRQVGIDNTRAPFIMFLDSDDLLAPGAIQNLNGAMLDMFPDMVIGQFYCEKKTGELELYDKSKTTWLHGNIYKRSFLEKNNIRFCEGYNEDGSFNTQCLLLSNKIAAIDRPVYYWRYNENSLTREDTNFTPRYFYHHIRALRYAYHNIYNHSHKKKIYFSLGEHLAQFVLIYNDVLLISKENSDFLAVKKESEKEIENFVKEEFFIEGTDKSAENILKGLQKGLEKYDISSLIISVEEFLKKFKIQIDITGWEFGYRDESNNN